MRVNCSMVVRDDFRPIEITPAFPPQLFVAHQFQPRSVTPRRIANTSLMPFCQLV